jgi:hypothetical protein
MNLVWFAHGPHGETFHRGEFRQRVATSGDQIWAMTQRPIHHFENEDPRQFRRAPHALEYSVAALLDELGARIPPDLHQAVLASYRPTESEFAQANVGELDIDGSRLLAHEQRFGSHVISTCLFDQAWLSAMAPVDAPMRAKLTTRISGGPSH